MILQEQEYIEYLEGHHRLLQFVGVKHQLINKDISLKNFFSISFQTKIKCREKFIGDQNILDEYIATKENKLDKIDIDIIKGFRNKISGDFVILKSLKNYSIFIGKKNIYGVTALGDPFSEIISEFPAYVRATLLPFRNKIIYDGFLEPYSIHFGKNIFESMNQQYQEAKKSGQIITNLLKI